MMYKITGREVWEVNSLEEFKDVMEKLDEADFCAEMSDSYAVTCSEKSVISRQRMMVIEQARNKGIIK